MSVFHTNILAGASGAGGAAAELQIDRSLRFNSGDSAHLSRTPSSAGNRKTWTWSCWMKKTADAGSPDDALFTAGTAGATQNRFIIKFSTGNQSLEIGQDVSGSFTSFRKTSQVFRDYNSWGHLVVAFNSPSANADDRLKIYWNGSQITDFATNNTITQNLDTFVNNTGAHYICDDVGNYHGNLDTYLAEVNFVDGTALAASDFGEYDSDNVWQPKEYSGSRGTNGFRLDFSDNSSASALGNDAAGSNNWTVNNLSVASGAGNDSLIDSPMNYTATSGNNGGNYCVLNPLDISGSSSTVSNGNLDCFVAGGASNVISGNFHLSSGKWYWEVAITSSTTKVMVGVADGSQPPSNREWQFEGWYYYGNNGRAYHDSSSAAYGSSFGQNDIIGVALDMDNGTLTFYKNGTSQGTAFSTGLSGLPIVPSVNNGGGTETHNVTFNFGQRPFVHTPPSNHLAICTQNLADPTIADGSTAFDIATYTGNSSTQNITGLNLSPEFLWIKSRTSPSSGNYHHLFDIVRGKSSGFFSSLHSNTTEAENTYPGSTYGGVTSFNSDGFSLSNVGSNDFLNKSSNTYVAWAWDAGSSTASNTDGTMTSSVRANTSAGFSICAYTSPNSSSNQSFGHGLNAKPDFVLVKNRDSSYNWDIYHSSLGYNSSLIFTNAATRSGAFSAEPTSTVVNTKHDYTHVNTDDYIAYCWTAVEGYSAFGSYEGTGSASTAAFVYTGMRPRWIVVKNADTGDSSTDWFIYDTARSTFNAVDDQLYPNRDIAEAATSTHAFDILSNGFKVRSTSTSGLSNKGGNTYVYAAFAEHPFKTARAR